MVKFAVAVGNPPFKKNLHLKIIDSIIPHIAGEGCFIHPARWFEDPLAKRKKHADKTKFKGIVDRLEDVSIIDRESVKKMFGITFNGELMISKIKSAPCKKDITIHNEVARKCVNIILAYSKHHNLAMVSDKNKRDGWRVEIKSITPPDPPILVA